jgi:hypothetical protein
MQLYGATRNHFETRWLWGEAQPQLEGAIAKADRVTTRSVLS